MKKIALLLIVGLSIFGTSCKSFLENDIDKVTKQNEQEILDYISKSNLQMLKTNTGLRYLITQNSFGRNVLDGDEVTYHYTLSLLNGAKIDSSSRLKNEPQKIFYSPNISPLGFGEAISLLKVGERGTFILPSNLAFGSRSSATIPANSVLKLDIEILKFLSEDEIIDNYVKATKIPLTEKTSTGLRFMRTVTTTGVAMKAGLLATVKYTGYLASNTTTQFDSGQIDVALGDKAVVAGFEEGLLKMKVGEKAYLVFPSKLGYGATGSGTKIPPYSSLIFIVEIVSAK